MEPRRPVFVVEDLVAALELLVAADAGSAAPSASPSRTQKMDRVVRFMINWISYELPRQPDEGQARSDESAKSGTASGKVGAPTFCRLTPCGRDQRTKPAREHR